MLYGLAGSELLLAAEAAGIRAVSEAFADRTYLADGSLMPRSETGSVIRDPAAAVAQALRIVRNGKAVTAEGTEAPLIADTLCVHGDGSEAPELVFRIRAGLNQEGIAVHAPTA